MASVNTTPVASPRGSPTPQKRASIVAHETRVEDKRFTVYKIEILTAENERLCVFHRYSEFRELFERLKDQLPKEDKMHFKFPGKRLIGSNFDPDFIESRQRGLDEFIQMLLSNPNLGRNPLVQQFFFAQPRHGRGHPSHNPDDLDEPEREGAPAGDDSRFDLGEGENRKASAEDFTMLKVIGKGSFGRVLLARHNASSKLYAIKVLNKDAIIRQNEVKHIMSERNVLLGNVKHPFLVGLHYSFQTRSKLFFVLDYVNGGELFFHLQREKKFSIPRSLFYAAEITSALGYMHDLNIVYRDLKPENILLDSAGHVKLTDFGLCKENVRPGQTTATFCGTPEYLAPEVLRKQSYGRAVDWWCLGCVTFEMMCGLPPFYSRDCNEMYERILHDSLRFPAHVPPDARSCLEGLLRRDPSQRLGGGERDAAEVMGHPVFRHIDWAALDRKEIDPPFNPNVMGQLDLKNFDPEFVSEPVPASVATGGKTLVGSQDMSVRSVKCTDIFDGFTFDPDRDSAIGASASVPDDAGAATP